MVFKKTSSRGGALLLDLLMIVLGINIALWFEGLAEDFNDQETEQEYLQGLRDDLTTDLSALNVAIKENQSKLELLQAIIPDLADLGAQPADHQLRTVFAPSSYYFFEPADFTYTSMRQSGDFHLLSEPEIKRGILRLARDYREIEVLQANYIQAMDAEYIPLLMAKFDLIGGRISDPDLLTNQVFRNFFMFALQETDQRVDTMKSAQKEAGDLLRLIEASIR